MTDLCNGMMIITQIVLVKVNHVKIDENCQYCSSQGGFPAGQDISFSNKIIIFQDLIYFRI